MRFAFPAEVSGAPDGVTVAFPDVPGAITEGGTRIEALQRAPDALISMLSSLVEDGAAIPAPSPAHGRPVVPVSAMAAAKFALHEAMLGARLSNIELGRRLDLDEKAVRRLRDPLHRSHIGAVEAALRELGRRLIVEIDEEPTAAKPFNAARRSAAP